MADYISREVAIETVKFYETECDPIPRAIDSLEQIPAADVRPVVHGAWERPKGFTQRSWIFVCSKCGDRAYFPVPKYFPKVCGYNYCPNCGADMRKDGGNG